MTRDELLSLPASVAIGLIWDASASLQQKLAAVEKPRGPLSPKFDRRIYRKGGFVWASESSLESLTYWLGKKTESAKGGGMYADKDAKDAEQLARWVTYRTWFPSDPWTGTRGNSEGVRAAAPSKSPRLHQTEPREEGQENPRAAAFRQALHEANRGDAYEDAGEGNDNFPPEPF